MYQTAHSSILIAKVEECKNALLLDVNSLLHYTASVPLSLTSCMSIATNQLIQID